MKYSFTKILSIGLVLCGHINSSGASPADIKNYDSSKSLALNIALHSGLTNEKGPLIDAAEADLQEALKGASDHATANAVSSTIDATVALKALLAPGKLFGYSPLLFIFSPSQLPHPALYPQIIAWMPRSEAADEKTAAQAIKTKITTAFLNSLPANYSFEEYYVEYSPLLARKYKSRFLSLVGPGCPNAEGLECRIDVSVQKPNIINSTPKWIEHTEESFYWKNWNDGATHPQSSIGIYVYYAKNKEISREYQNNWMNDYQDEVLTKMSKQLDGWIYIYAPPTTKKPYPIMLNFGNIFYFAKPNS